MGLYSCDGVHVYALGEKGFSLRCSSVMVVALWSSLATMHAQWMAIVAKMW